MRSCFAILCILLCSGPTRADDLLVIKDSEAIQYVGRRVEVWGFVVSVTSSPLGTSFINFEREYPNQIFAGFIAAGSKVAEDQRLTMLQGKVIGISGTIEIVEGRPEIKIMSADQIKGGPSPVEAK